MDGLEASRRIKNNARVQHQPAIVLVTAFGREEVREEAEALHLDGFLVKPVTKSMIVDTLVSVFAESAADGLAVGSGADAGATRLRGVRILLTEDNEINQQVAVELLEGAGATVDIANNGREAVEILCAPAHPPRYDVVLMDLQMPEMDGFQATARIRDDARFARLPIIAMTAHATLEERQRCLAAGMNDHVAKPVDPAALFETVGRHVQVSDISAADREVGASPSPARPAVADAVELPSVEGLDVADGLLRLAGNRALYRKLLTQFVEQQAAAPDRIAALLDAGGHAEAERLAHTLKGVAGNLGARGIQAAAAELERAIAGRGERGGIEALRQRAGTELGGLIERLRPVLDVAATSAPAAPSAPVALEPLIREMRKRLDEFDPVAAELLDQHRAAFGTLFSPDDLAAFAQHLQAYELEPARALLERAATAQGL
jgi:two-component system sensor histidine kinase/response regulator